MKKKLLISASIALILCLSLFISYKNITKNKNIEAKTILIFFISSPILLNNLYL